MICSLLQKADPPTQTKAVCEVGVDGDTCGEEKFANETLGFVIAYLMIAVNVLGYLPFELQSGTLCVGVTVTPTQMAG